MCSFYLGYTEYVRNLPQPAAEMPWMHNAVLIEKVKDLSARVWHMRQAIEYGWSRLILDLHIQQAGGLLLTHVSVKSEMSLKYRHFRVYKLESARE